MNVDDLSAERSFLEYVYGCPREPNWITEILCGIESSEEPDIQEMKQVSKQNQLIIDKTFDKSDKSLKKY